MKSPILLLLVLFLFIASTAEAIDFFAFEAKNCNYQTKSGMLNGDFSNKYPNGELMVEGQFTNNQRVGTWNFYSVNGRLIEKRLYFNNYEYAVMSKAGKVWKQFNANGTWSLIKESDVKFHQRIWKKVNKEAGGYLNIDKLVSAINNNAKGDFYEDERFTNRIDKKQLNNISSLLITEDYVYDNKQENMFTRTVGIGFVNNQNETVGWIYFGDWMNVFKNTKTTWHNDHMKMNTLYDVFSQRAYSATPYKKQHETMTNKTMVELELEMIHMENMFIIAKA